MRCYSPFFQTLHDEVAPVGKIGRGTHYSVLRMPMLVDEAGAVCAPARVQDVAVVWDEDHDERAIQALSRLYFAGLTAPIMFIGEQKGTLCVVLHPDVIKWPAKRLAQFKSRVEEVAQPDNDQFNHNVGTLEESNIVADEIDHVRVYCASIDVLWRLGPKDLPLPLAHPSLTPSPSPFSR